LYRKTWRKRGVKRAENKARLCRGERENLDRARVWVEGQVTETQEKKTKAKSNEGEETNQGQ